MEFQQIFKFNLDSILNIMVRLTWNERESLVLLCSEEIRLKERGEEGRIKSIKKRKVKVERLKRWKSGQDFRMDRGQVKRNGE